MPTIAQLPVAGSTSPTDELPVAQGDVTRGVSLATLLANLQPLIVVNGEVLLGRTSAGPGGVELITPGVGLALSQGTLSATGAEQAGFALQPVLTLTDEAILNSGGQARRLPLALLRGLFVAGTGIAIDGSGVISAAVPAFLTGLGAPAAGLGVVGDRYLDVSSGNLWALLAGGWSATGSNILAPEATVRAADLAPLVALKASSVGTVAAQLTLDGTSQTAAATLALPNARGVMRITGSVTAQNLASGDAMIWDVAAAFQRSGVGAVPQLVGTASVSVFAADASMSGCDVVVAANSSGGVIEGVGLSGQAINWSAALLAVIGT
jgi:hypothetical protein